MSSDGIKHNVFRACGVTASWAMDYILNDFVMGFSSRSHISFDQHLWVRGLRGLASSSACYCKFNRGDAVMLECLWRPCHGITCGAVPGQIRRSAQVLDTGSPYRPWRKREVLSLHTVRHTVGVVCCSKLHSIPCAVVHVQRLKGFRRMCLFKGRVKSGKEHRSVDPAGLTRSVQFIF